MTDSINEMNTQYVRFFENYLEENSFCYDDEPQQKLFQAMSLNVPENSLILHIFL